MKRHCCARSLNRVVRVRGDGSMISGIALSPGALIRGQLDQVPGEFRGHWSYQQLDCCISSLGATMGLKPATTLLCTHLGPAVAWRAATIG